MRSMYSIKNSLVAILMYIITIAFGFVAQKVFINTLGNEYLGLNSLFNNIVSMLAIAELGFGTAVIANLYKPVAENDYDAINKLLNFYKKCYKIIAIIVFVIGMMIIPFIKSIVGEISITENLYIIYLLFLADAIVSYIFTYKRSLLYADQKTYYINIVHIIYVVVINSVQIFILLNTGNYILYLISKIICRFVENIAINIIVNKKYRFLSNDKKYQIDSLTKNSIIKKVKGLLFHRIGSFIVLGTDNIIISKFIGIVSVGLYSNYYMIIYAITSLLSHAFSSITGSVGNLLVESNKEKNYKTFKNIFFVGSILYTTSMALLLNLLQPFITVWLGKDYLLPISVVIVLCINFYLQGMRNTFSIFKDAAGIFYQDRFVPIIESIVNIVSSILLAKLLGLVGVFIGTIISCLVIYLYSLPKFVYGELFGKTFKYYIIDVFRYYILDFLLVGITVGICTAVPIGNIVFQIVIRAVITILIISISIIFIYRKTNEYKYFKKIFINILYKLKVFKVNNNE